MGRDTAAGAGRRRLGASMALASAALLLAGCGLHVPSDPYGTEDRVRGGTMNVGVTHNPPWTDIDASGQPTGSEVELVERFASELDADIDWTEGSEATLVDGLENGDLDLVIGGFVDDTPWQDRTSVTRWYTEIVNDRGDTEKHVMLARMGENRFVVSLETFLDGVGS